VAKKTVDDYIEDLDEFVSKNIKKIPYGRLQVWKDLVFEPNETIKSEMKNASLMGGAKDVAVSSLVYIIAMALYFAEFMGFFFLLAFIPIVLGTSGGLWGCIYPIIIAVLIAIAIIIACVLFCVIGWLFYSGVEFLLARLFGGKGDYTTHAYLEALSTASMAVALTPFMLLYLIPCLFLCVGVIAQPFMMLIGIYNIYLRHLIVRQVHGLDRNKSIAVVLIPIVVGFVLAGALYIGFLLISIVAGGKS
jgi:hypothetical protein